ncbi:MAG: ABC transporter ATP-binding protein/permease [Firmicutes bacterium]|nr:ABC transporter ATP-binding protein/permease [Bacillota bacterium]
MRKSRLNEREYQKGNKKYMFIFMGLLVAVEGLALAFPMVLQGVTERIIEAQSYGTITTGQILLSALGVFGFIVLIFLVTMAMEYSGALYGNRYATNIRRKLFNKLQKVSGDTLEEFGTSKVLPVLFNDTAWMRLYRRRTVAAFVFIPVAIFGSFIMMFMLNPWYGLIGLGAVPFLVLFFWLSSRRMNKIFASSIDAFDSYFSNVKEGVIGARDIRILGKAEERDAEFKKVVDEHQVQVRTSDTLVNFSLSFHALLFTAITVVIIIFGVTVIDLQTAQQLVELNTALQYIVRVQGAGHLIFVWFFEHIPRIRITKTRIQEVYDLPEIKEDGGLKDIPNFAEPRLEFSNINYTYANQARGLIGINMIVPYNTRVAVSGGIGSGKSVLPKLLLGDLQPHSGEILFNQIDTASINNNSLRSSVFSYASPTPDFVAGSIRDNMKLLAPSVTDEEILQAFADIAPGWNARFDNFLDFELSPKRPMSDGMRNLLNIVRAVLKPAPLYIFNQCFEHIRTEYLDNLMTRLAKDKKTALFMTYDAAICKRCDNIYVLKSGRIKGEGTHAHLLKTNSEYQRFYASTSGTILQEAADEKEEIDTTEVGDIISESPSLSVEVVTS